MKATHQVLTKRLARQAMLLASLALLPLLPLAAQGPASAQNASAGHGELGRLFFTPQQRQELDRRRQLNIKESPEAIQEDKLTVNGLVSRSSGRTTTWLNRVPQNDTYHPLGSGAVPIRSGENEPQVPLKVGQSLDRTRGSVSDGLGGGEIKIKPGPVIRR